MLVAARTPRGLLPERGGCLQQACLAASRLQGSKRLATLLPQWHCSRASACPVLPTHQPPLLTVCCTGPSAEAATSGLKMQNAVHVFTHSPPLPDHAQWEYAARLAAACGPDVASLPSWRAEMYDAAGLLKKVYADDYRDRWGEGQVWGQACLVLFDCVADLAPPMRARLVIAMCSLLAWLPGCQHSLPPLLLAARWFDG